MISITYNDMQLVPTMAPLVKSLEERGYEVWEWKPTGDFSARRLPEEPFEVVLHQPQLYQDVREGQGLVAGKVERQGVCFRRAYVSLAGEFRRHTMDQFSNVRELVRHMESIDRSTDAVGFIARIRRLRLG